jgi:hypothetical protein
VRYLEGETTYHYYPTPGRCSFLTLVVQEGVVKSASEVSVLEDRENATFDELTEAGCEPLIVEQMISPYPVYVFPEAGIAFEVVEGHTTGVVRRFEPTTPAAFLDEWNGVDLRLDPSLNQVHLLEPLRIEPGVTTQSEVDESLGAGTTVEGVQVLRKNSSRSLGGLLQRELHLRGQGKEPSSLEHVARIAFKEGKVFTAELAVTPHHVPRATDYGYSETDLVGVEIYTLGDALRDYGEPSMVFVTERGGTLEQLRLVYPGVGRQVTVSAATSASDVYCLTLNSAVAKIVFFESASEAQFRDELPMLWHDDFAIHAGESRFLFGSYREIEWQGLGQFCEVDGLATCCRP